MQLCQRIKLKYPLGNKPLELLRPRLLSIGRSSAWSCGNKILSMLFFFFFLLLDIASVLWNHCSLGNGSPHSFFRHCRHHCICFPVSCILCSVSNRGQVLMQLRLSWLPCPTLQLRRKPGYLLFVHFLS